MLKTIAKAFFVVFLISFLMLLLVAGVTDTIQPNSLLAFFGYLCLTLFTIKFFEKKLSATSAVIILFTSMFLMQSYTIYLYFVESLWSLPIILIYCLGIISAFFYLKLKRPVNILPFSLSFLMVILMFFQGWDYWIHKINFGTFTGRIAAYNLPVKFESFDEQKNPISENDFNNKIVLLDFWMTTCGICFQKFPQLQTAYDKYKNDSSVIILAVNTPFEEDKPNQAFNDIRKRGYSFPVVVTKGEDLAEKFGVKGYPTTFVINQNSQIIYKGDVEGAVKMVEELKLNSR
jgi:thiol-disulfide isomerase/thioredoxin